jgi:hypothetical protein
MENNSQKNGWTLLPMTQNVTHKKNLMIVLEQVLILLMEEDISLGIRMIVRGKEALEA